MNEIINIQGIECYEKDGTAYLKLDTVARGLGFTQIAASGNEVVRWERVRKYLSEFGIPTCGDADFIPENVFYRLAMKAKNETAERFQAFIADEVIPSIRKHGAYMTPETLEAAILNPDTLIKLCTALKEEQDKRKALEAANTALTVDNAVMKLKADYFDELVDRNLLTNFRETAKQLGIKEKEFIRFLLEKKYLYRDKRGKLMPYAEKNSGLFEIKECFNEKTLWSGTQTLITPKGRETFRLLYVG
jgi:phage antirepressor YoqD-like protein